MTLAERCLRLLPALWAGGLLCVALLAAPAAFASLLPSDAGRVVGQMLTREAYASLVLAALLLLLQRARVRRGLATQFNLEMGLVLGTVFCTIGGHFVLQPMIEAARHGHAAALSFGQLHALSVALFGAKGLLVLALAWRAAAPAATRAPGAAAVSRAASS